MEHDLDRYLGVVTAALVTYVWLVALLRVSGKRSLAKLNAFDFVVTVAFGSMLSTVILTRDIDWVTGAVGLLMLTALQYVVSKSLIHSEWLQDLVRSKPALLVENGQVDDGMMQNERITRSDLEAAVRGHGYGRMEQVAAVVLETDGTFSVIGRSDGPVELLHQVRRAEV